MSSSSPALIRILLLPLMLVIATGLGGSANAATTLSPPAALNHNAVLDSDFDAFPDVATDRDGTWIAVWDAAASDTTIDCSGSSDGTCGPDREILYAISTDAGESWSDATFLNTDAESDTASDLKPLIATDRNGTWMVVWSRNDEAAVATSTDAGQTWSTPQVLSDVELTFGYVIETMDLITDRQGTWMLVWSSNGQGTDGQANQHASAVAQKDLGRREVEVEETAQGLRWDLFQGGFCPPVPESLLMSGLDIEFGVL